MCNSFDELKHAHAEGKTIQIYGTTNGWQDMNEQLEIIGSVYAQNRGFIDDSVIEQSLRFIEEYPPYFPLNDGGMERLYSLLFIPFNESSGTFERYHTSLTEDSGLAKGAIDLWIDILRTSRNGAFKYIIEALESDESQYEFSNIEVHP